MARVARGRRRRYSPSAGGLGTSSSCSTRRSCRTWAPRLQRTTGCLSRPTRAAGSSRGRPPPAVFGPAALARVLGAPATSVSEARTRRTNEEQPTGVSSSLTRLSVVKKPRVKRLAGGARGVRASHHPLGVTVIVTTPSRAGTLMARCSARGVTGGTLVEAGSGAGGRPASRGRRALVSSLYLSHGVHPNPSLQKRTLVQCDIGTCSGRRHWCQWKSMLRKPVFFHTLPTD
jgi:hypothetical protein